MSYFWHYNNTNTIIIIIIIQYSSRVMIYYPFSIEVTVFG